MDPCPPIPAAGPPRDAAVQWLMGRVNYERVAQAPYNERQLKLDRMRQLLARLGSPEAGLRIVHIAGSKGKGSTAAMIAAVLTEAGLRTGVYSSPHLERIEERFAVDGRPCDGAALARLVDLVRPVVEAMDREDADRTGVGRPTFFDITTAIALLLFAEQKCDAVVLEVGLGGRLDSTNVCLPVLSIITSISFDHTKQLGDTLAKIAREKAGIIKPGVPVISGVAGAEPRDVIARVAQSRGSRLLQRGQAFGLEPRGEGRGVGGLDFWRLPTLPGGGQRESMRGLALRMRGPHQRQNAAVALAAACELRDSGWPITAAACRAGLAGAQIAARVEWFPATADRPAVIVDTAHNGASAAALLESLGPTPGVADRTLVLAISRDKQVGDILAALAPGFSRVIATRFLENPRAVEPSELAGRLASLSPPGACVQRAASPLAAYELALRATPLDGLVVVAGSFFLAAELRPVVAAGDRRDAAGSGRTRTRPARER